jgi:NADP-dependent 3-hydroxy acid dehydrogenase YdfG
VSVRRQDANELLRSLATHDTTVSQFFSKPSQSSRIFSPCLMRLCCMTSLQGKTAVVTGGSSGVGKATVKALISEGVRVVAVARGADRLRALEAEVGEGLTTLQGDAADAMFAERVTALKPDFVVLAAGVTPRMARIDEHDWESFSAPWNGDLKSTFHFVKLALTQPLIPGSMVIVVSSGAAVRGSPLSGGYAGAKRMQWFLAGYGQRVSDAKQLGIRMLAILPVQFIEGTTIGSRAAAAYGAMNGISAEATMKQFAVPLDASKVASAIVTALRGGVAAGITAVSVNGTGIEPLT